MGSMITTPMIPGGCHGRAERRNAIRSGDRQAGCPNPLDLSGNCVNLRGWPGNERKQNAFRQSGSRVVRLLQHCSRTCET